MAEGFRDPLALSRLAVGMLWVWLATSVALGLSSAYTIAAITADQAGNAPAWLTLESADNFSTITGSISLVALLATAMIVGRWMYRVNKNAWRVSDTMTVSPGWNIGFFAVPILNLFKPFTGIRETWQVSHAPYAPDTVAVPVTLRLWWGSWLTMNAVGQVSFRLTNSASTLEEFRTVAYVNGLSTGVDLVAGGALIWIVGRLSQAQHRLLDHRVFE